MIVLQRLGELPFGRAVILSFILMGVYYLIAFDDGGKLRAQLDQATSRNNEVQSEIDKTDKELKEIAELKLAQEKDVNRLNLLLGFIPERLTKIELMRMLSNESKAVGANILGITDSGISMDKSEFYDEIAVEVTLSGSFSQLMLFISNLTRLKQIVTLSELAFTVTGISDTGVILNMTTKVRGYKYVANKTVPGSGK